MTINRKHHLALTLLGIAGVVGLLAGAASSPQLVNPHADERIGTKPTGKNVIGDTDFFAAACQALR
jgi:hypothetical protein